MTTTTVITPNELEIRVERVFQAARAHVFQNHLQTLEFEELGDRTKLRQTMRFATTEERDA
jgi:hypothetical protein